MIYDECVNMVNEEASLFAEKLAELCREFANRMLKDGVARPIEIQALAPYLAHHIDVALMMAILENTTYKEKE